MQRYAWITYVNNDEYFDAACVLLHNLKQLNTQHKFIIMVPENHQLNVEKLKYENVEVITIPDLQRASATHASERYRFCINKIYLWSLTQYDKLCWLDVDLLVLKNIDHLFEIEMGGNAILAAPGCTCNSLKNSKFHTRPLECPFNDANKVYMNAGLFITRPSISIFEHFLTRQSYDFPLAEQDAFNEYFKGRIGLISSKYNYLNHLPIAHPHVADKDISVFHFGYGKPWDKNVLSLFQSYYDAWLTLRNSLINK